MSLRDMKLTPLKQDILERAARVRHAHAVVNETFLLRDKGPSYRKAWQDACSAFHEYAGDAFAPYRDDLKADLAEGRPEAIEFALSFLECRPYYYRSGYLYRNILRWVKRLPMSQLQAKRRDLILACYAEYRAGAAQGHFTTGGMDDMIDGT